MKKYLIFTLMSLVSLNVCAGSKMEELVDRLTYTLEFGYDDRSQELYNRRIAHEIYDCDDIQQMLESVNYTTQDMLKSIIDDYVKQVKNPYVKHMIMVYDQKINITILDLVLLNKVQVYPDNSKERKVFESNLKFLIVLLKRYGFKQTIPNSKLKRVATYLDEGECPDCVAFELAKMGLK